MIQDPIDILGDHPAGAHERSPDPRDYVWDSLEIGGSSAPFDWSRGYDVEVDSGIKLPIKNQGASFSCGGQAMAYYGQILGAFGGNGAERSAKYIYSQAFAPGGGSADRELAKIAIRQGFAEELLCASYQGKNTPTEEFMENPGDITVPARDSAATDQALAYAFPTVEIDTIARAIRDCKGVVLGIYGKNNGTWLSADPLPPDDYSGHIWRHYMYFGKALMENGIKKIWGKQSWGPTVGYDGWQKLSQAYFDAHGIWSAMTLLKNLKPVKPQSYIFLNDLKLFDNNPEVKILQQILAYDGQFDVDPTGYFGSVTANAVMKFQLKYSIATTQTIYGLEGKIVGPATRAKLNGLLK